MFETRKLRDATRSAAKELGCHDLKLEQLAVIETFVKGRDVFAVLLMGYGKSLALHAYLLCFTNCWVWVEIDGSIAVVDSFDT